MRSPSGLPRDAAVLLQRGQPHPFVEQGGDDLTQAMVELDRVRLVELALVGDVADRPVEAGAVRGLEVGVLDHEQPVVPRIAHRLEHRMAFPDEQPPTRPEQGRHDGRPPADVGEPVQRPDPGVDEVEALAAEHVRRGVDVGQDELDVGTGAGGEVAGGVDRRRREVEAASPGRRAGPARWCRCRCGTGGARSRGRRCRRGGVGRTPRRPTAPRDRRGAGRSGSRRGGAAPGSPSSSG